MYFYLYKLDEKIFKKEPYMRDYVLTRFSKAPAYYTLVQTYDTAHWTKFDEHNECTIEIWEDTYFAMCYPTRDMLPINDKNLLFYWDVNELTDESFHCWDCKKKVDEPDKQPICTMCSQLICADCLSEHTACT